MIRLTRVRLGVMLMELSAVCLDAAAVQAKEKEIDADGKVLEIEPEDDDEPPTVGGDILRQQSK